ncbi:flagellar assembly protein H [Shewanella submarina]|uniref:Flagellar assembly protein FliH n=1 Tax=Shewanella submarina TaxID=2016376 RepID=A0ABV7GJ59_9GAMM|nr:flagellar assembly protein FliH [Shewanella submarina]MCL1038741.1 flagellar assembly protein H [Shewanella submarina]
MESTRWRLNGTFARRHQFAPLQVREAGEADAGDWQDYQQAFDKGYDEGVSQGYEAGRQNGEEEGKRAGYAAGFHQGRVEGQQQGKMDIDQQLNEIITPISALKALLEEGHKQQVLEQQQLIVDLVRRVAHQVIRCELTLQPQQIIALVEETLSALPANAKDIRIHLQPAAVNELEQLAPEKIKDWHLVADASISQGGCRVISDQCDADASVETRLDTCMDQVEAHLARQTEAGVGA